MANYTQGYERNLPSPKFAGDTRYNPTITNYYGSDDALVRVEEEYGGVTYAQTISGSAYAQQWPAYSYSVTYMAWEDTTVS
jgi:hypothetical protein